MLSLYLTPKLFMGKKWLNAIKIGFWIQKFLIHLPIILSQNILGHMSATPPQRLLKPEAHGPQWLT